VPLEFFYKGGNSNYKFIIIIIIIIIFSSFLARKKIPKSLFKKKKTLFGETSPVKGKTRWATTKHSFGYCLCLVCLEHIDEATRTHTHQAMLLQRLWRLWPQQQQPRCLLRAIANNVASACQSVLPHEDTVLVGEFFTLH